MSETRQILRWHRDIARRRWRAGHGREGPGRPPTGHNVRSEVLRRGADQADGRISLISFTDEGRRDTAEALTRLLIEGAADEGAEHGGLHPPGVRYLPATSLILLAAPGMTSGLRPRLRSAARTTGPGRMDGRGSLAS